MENGTKVLKKEFCHKMHNNNSEDLRFYGNHLAGVYNVVRVESLVYLAL